MPGSQPHSHGSSGFSVLKAVKGVALQLPGTVRPGGAALPSRLLRSQRPSQKALLDRQLLL